MFAYVLAHSGFKSHLSARHPRIFLRSPGPAVSFEFVDADLVAGGVSN